VKDSHRPAHERRTKYCSVRLINISLLDVLAAASDCGDSPGAGKDSRVAVGLSSDGFPIEQSMGKQQGRAWDGLSAARYSQTPLDGGLGGC
jgi:hypothetical protein